MPSLDTHAEHHWQDLNVDSCRTQMRLLGDCNPAMVWISGTDAKCMFFNQSWLKFTGRSLERELGNGWMESVHPDDVKSCFDTYIEAFSARHPFTLAYRLRRVDGVFRWVQDTGAPCYDEDGTFTGYVGSCVDITDQRQALIDAENRFRLLVHSVKEYAIVTLDTKTRVLSWNEGAERITGYAASEAIGRECASFFRLEEREHHVPQKIFDAAAEEGHLEVEGWLTRKDGTLFLAMSSITALRDESGRLTGYGKVVRDITERRALESELVRAKDALQMLVDVSPLAIVQVDNARRVMLWNHAAERLFGWRSDEVIGKPLPAGLGDGEASQRTIVSRDLRRVRRDGIELKLRRRDGEFVDAALWTAPYVNGEQNIVGTVRVYADVRERNRTMARLTDANRRLRRLSERMLEVQENERRHIARELHDEIGQALTAVKLKLEATIPVCPIAACANPIKDSVAMCDIALTTVKQLFLGLRPPQLDDLGLVAAVRWHLHQQGREAGFETRFAADPLPRLEANQETAIFRIIQEALTNVVRHASARLATVEMHMHDGELRVSVSDDGRGFDVSARYQGGENMGISGMEERVTLLNGRFELQSTPGKGTTIRAKIPILARNQ